MGSVCLGRCHTDKQSLPFADRPAMPQPDGATLIARMLNEHGAALALYASQWTSAAEDCVQEALIELARQATPPANPKAWLYRVVRNRAHNAARAARRRARHEDWATRLRPTTADAVEIELTDALATLTNEIREVIVLRIWGRLTWEELADVAGGSSTTMQRRFAEGLRTLKQIWETEPCRTTNESPPT